MNTLFPDPAPPVFMDPRLRGGDGEGVVPKAPPRQR